MSARDDLFTYLTNNPTATDADASRSTGIPVIQVKKFRAEWLATSPAGDASDPQCAWCGKVVAEKGTLCNDCRYVPEDIAGIHEPEPARAADDLIVTLAVQATDEPETEPADPLDGFDLTQPTTYVPSAPLLRQPVLRAADLAALLASEVFDAQDAAAYLGIRRNSLEYAASRNRLSFVQYGSKKLFTRTDLDEYRANAVRGRGSRLVSRDPVVVRAGKR